MRRKLNLLLVLLGAIGGFCLANSAEIISQPQILESFQKYLNESGNQMIFDEPILTIELRSAAKFVTIAFRPETPAQKAIWGTIVDLNAQALVTIIQRLKSFNYFPPSTFEYAVPINFFNGTDGAGPSLSQAALKTLAG